MNKVYKPARSNNSAGRYTTCSDVTAKPKGVWLGMTNNKEFKEDKEFKALSE